jgi:magnesium transporter
MTDQPAGRPAPLSRVWSGSKIIAEDLEGDDLSDVLELHAEASAWWLLPRDSERSVRQLHEVADQLDLDGYAIKDLLDTDRRAKFEEFGQARIVIANAVSFDRELARLEEHPVSLVITDRVLICSADRFDGFDAAASLGGNDQGLAAGGSEAALQAVISALITTYEAVADWLEEATGRLTGALFDGRPLDKNEQICAFRLRAALSQLRRLTDPMRTVISELAESAPQSMPQPTHTVITRRWGLLSERHQRVANAADALREALASVFDTSVALADLRMNQLIKKITAWAAIIAVPPLVTRFVGQNVVFPLSGSALGFWVYLAVVIVAGIILYLAFRVKNWI